MTQGRSLFKQIITNFINSLKPKKYWGELKGTDSFGTEYYESTDSLTGHRRPTRWFVPKQTGNFEQERPVEWTAWLSYKRKDPPTEEEIQSNLRKMEQTLENARKLEKPKTADKEELQTSEKIKFPVYQDYKEGTGFN